MRRKRHVSATIHLMHRTSKKTREFAPGHSLCPPINDWHHYSVHPRLQFVMRLRRLTALLSGICALSFTLGQGSVSCKNTSSSGSSAMSAAANAHSGMNEHRGEKQTHHKPCESSAVVCCQAMASCGVSVSIDQTTRRDGWIGRETGTLPSHVQVGLNLIIPPEPPPPKS